MRAIVPSDVGSYSYAGTNYANPHAVTGIGYTGGATTTYVYDNNGNLTSAGNRGYEWDWRNRLTAAGATGGATTTYLYNHENQRVQKKTSSATTTFVNMYYNIASSTRNATATKHIFTPSGELLATVVGTSSNASTTYLHPDHLGGTNVATDEDGDGVQVLDYYPYGSQRIATGSFNEQRKFTGHEHDPESDLTYANARYYEQDIGRWMSQDPQEGNIANPQSLNTYAYSLNNPIKYLDPNGEAAVLFSGFSSDAGGMNEIKAKIIDRSNQLGMPAPFVGVYSWHQTNRALQDITGLLEQNPAEPIVIAGHSWGGGRAADLARMLGNRGVEVDSLIQIDAFGLFDEGELGNVKRRYNFSASGEIGSDLIGPKKVRGAGFNNINFEDMSHTDIDSNPLVQQTVVREVIQAFAAARQKAIYDFVMNPLTPFGALANFWKQRHAEYLAESAK